MTGFITRSSRTLKLVLSVTYKPTPPPLLSVLGLDNQVSYKCHYILLSFVFSQASVSPTKSNFLSSDLRLHSIFSIFLEILLQFIYKVDIEQVDSIFTCIAFSSESV